MSAADKIAAARSIVAEFDESFFAHRKQFLRDALSEMADLADAQAQEIARLREALKAMLGRHTLYCGGEGLPFAGHTDVKLFEMARAALGDAP